MNSGVRMFERFEPNLERGLMKYCQICSKQFGVFNREHQCKRCFRAICADCGTTKRDVYKPKMNKRPHRLCSPCTKESDFLIQYIAVNQLRFGHDSEIAIKWVKKLPENLGDKSSLMQSQGKHRKLTVQIFSQLWDAYNFSLREFIGLLTFSSNQTEIFKLVESTYEDLQSRGCEQKMQYSVMLIMFLLCFSSTSTCCDLVEYLISLKKTVSDSKQLLQLYLKALSIEEGNIKKLSDYFSYKLKQYMGAFSINTISAECSIHVLSRVLQKRKIEEAYMLFALVIERNCEFLINNRTNKIQCDIRVIRTCDLEAFLQKYRLLVSVKTSSLVTQRSLSTISQPKSKLESDQKSQRDNSGGTEEIKFVANFKKKKNSIEINSGSEEDSFTVSNKTMSIRDEDPLEPRKTQKNISNMSMRSDWNSETFFNEKRQKQSSSVPNIIVHERCRECDHKDIKIRQLESLLKEKQRQLTKLTLKLNFTAGLEEEENRPRKQTEEFPKSNPHILKLENEVREKREQNENLFKELNRYQKDYHTMKSQIQQLSMNNRMLKNRLESDNMSPQRIRNTEKEEQLTRINQMMEKKLMDKNKELEELIKKNKLLAFQVEEMEKQKGDRRKKSDGMPEPVSVNIKSEELMEKLKEISEQITIQEQQKISLSREVFQLKQKIKSLEAEAILQNKRNTVVAPEPVQKDNGNKQCSLF